MFDGFKTRSLQLEHIDTGDYTPEEYEGCIVELKRVNQWMGDARALKKTLLKYVEDREFTSFSVLDVGAGSGELLRVTAEWCRQRGQRLLALGLELNERSARAMADESKTYREIKAIRGDALQLPFADAKFDFVICSLFTHHFGDKQVVAILREMSRVARRRIFVIDLHRHPIAYLLYTTVGKLVLHTRLVREDGALSILRSFKADEMYDLAERAGLQDCSVARHFPFRLVLEAAARNELVSTFRLPTVAAIDDNRAA
jgi:ubiquinone/menaquinone biosynthesis C-methylase UbiE